MDLHPIEFRFRNSSFAEDYNLVTYEIIREGFVLHLSDKYFPNTTLIVTVMDNGWVYLEGRRILAKNEFW